MCRKCFYFLFVLFIFVLLTTTSCSGSQLSIKEKAFKELVDVKEMNTKIKFWFPDDPRAPSKHIINEVNDLVLESHTNSLVRFSNDFGIMLLSYNQTEGKWVEIENDMSYSGYAMLPPKGPDSPGYTSVGFSPKLENTGQPVEIRVVVIGNEYPNDIKGEQVAAYVDVVLQP